MKNPFKSTHTISNDLSALMLRLLVGGIMIFHGYAKLTAFQDMYTTFPDVIGLGSRITYILVVFAEFFCGILVALGFLTRLSIIPILITMAVAYFVVHKADPFHQKELAFVFMVLSVVVFIVGSGRIALDRLIFKK